MIPVLSPATVIPAINLIDIIRDLGLTTNLQLCLDAGDIRSYDGTSQTWIDQSTSGTNFLRGTTSGSESSDPTFNGSAGRESLNEHFSYNGSQIFTVSGSVPSWASAFHKDNAQLTMLEWCYSSNITSGSQICGEIFTGNSSTSSTYFGNSSSLGGLGLSFSVQNAAGSTILLTSTASLTFSNNAWNMLGVTLNETTGALSFYSNGSFESQTGKTYSSPDTDSAGTFNIGGDTIGPEYENSGNRVAMIAIWSTPLTAAQIASLYAATRTRFGV